MSYRNDWMDCETHVRAIDDLIKTDFGDHAATVSAAFVELNQHLGDTWRVMRIAMYSAIAERHAAARDEALAEAERIARGDDE